MKKEEGGAKVWQEGASKLNHSDTPSWWNSRRGRLTLGDSIVGAYRCAATARDAGIGIDMIDFSFGDCLYGAYGHAGAACDAVVANYVSHCVC